MTDTMISMEWRCVDNLTADTLEIGDNILGAEGEIVEIIGIDEYEEHIVVMYSDDYGDVYSEQFSYEKAVDIYMLFDVD